MIKVEIFHGNIGTVRNELTQFLNEDVETIQSLTQSVSTTGGGTTPLLTLILIYIPIPDDKKREKLPKTKEEYL